MNRPLPTLLALALLAAAAPRPVSAAVLEVGPGRAFDHPAAALARAQPGDEIRVFPRPDDQPYARVALAISLPRLTLRAAEGAQGRVVFSGDGFDYSGRGAVPRAIVQFNPGAADGVVEGLVLTGAHNGSHNGAGVRVNQADRVSVRGCVIHGNDMGIMSNGDGGKGGADQLIENCLIHGNGAPADPGYNHNLYLGGLSVTVRGCEIHSSITGHNVKSRARRTVVEGCRVYHAANREIDLVDGEGFTDTPGSDAVLVGNVIVKDPKCAGNRGVIHFGQDGGKGHDGTLYLVHNTIHTPFGSPVVQLSSSDARASFWNNLVWNEASRQQGQTLLAGQAGVDLATRVAGGVNLLASGFRNSATTALALDGTRFGEPGATLPWVDAVAGDYRLAREDARVSGAGAALPEAVRKALGGPVVQYRAPRSTAARSDAVAPDLGAFSR